MLEIAESLKSKVAITRSNPDLISEDAVRELH